MGSLHVRCAQSDDVLFPFRNKRMPKKTSLKVEGWIRGRAKDKRPSRKKANELKDRGIAIGKTTVNNIIKNNGKERSHETWSCLKAKTPVKKLTKFKLKELDPMVSKTNPLT